MIRHMLRLGTLLLACTSHIASPCLAASFDEDLYSGLTRHVDPLIGSDAHGHVFVGASVPFGAVQLGLTNFYQGWDWCSGYHYSDNVAVGFSHTHLSGTGIGDLCDIVVAPFVGVASPERGDRANTEPGYASKYSHDTETARAGYYAVDLEDDGIRAELTASERVGWHRYTFPEGVTPRVAIDLEFENGSGRATTTIMRAAADNVKSLSFELGGKNAAIVFEDADLEQAIDGSVRSVFSNCGQVCLCSERVYVHESIFDDFVEELKARAAALRMGYPDDEQTEIGPLVSKGHRDKVLSYYRLAREEGATVVTGGGIPEFGDERDNGAWVEPTILTGLPESARCVREEIFGPVCHVAPFATEEEAVSMVNDSAYGLAAAVWTTNLSRAHRVARQIEAGIVWVNTWYLRDLRTPFGGVKLSGIGREGGIHSLNFYSEPTNICIKL